MTTIKESGNDYPSDNNSSLVENAGDKKMVGMMKSKYSSLLIQHNDVKTHGNIIIRGKSPQASQSSANVFIPFGSVKDKN